MLSGSATPSAAMTRRPVEPAAAYAGEVRAADRAHRRVRPATVASPGITLDESYRAARAIVRAREKDGERIAGFKGGLARPGQLVEGKRVEPIVGVLFRSGALPMGASVDLGAYRTLVVEAELAFTFKRDIVRPIADIAALKAAVGTVRPAVELPDISLEGPVRSAQDLIAINIGSARFILGPEFPPHNTQLSGLSPTLTRDGLEVARGTVPEAIGDPWILLQRLVNTAIANGYPIRSGHSILAGTIAAVPNAPAGAYVADFGPLGQIPFTIAPTRPTTGT